MKKNLSRILALILASVLLLLGCASCANKGKTLLTLEKDGVSVTFSVNLYELMLSRMKGSLAFYGYTANGVTVEYDSFWTYKDKFNGSELQTINEFYCDTILDNCRTYLAALYLFEKEGLKLSAAELEDVENKMFELIRTDGDGSKTKLNAVLASYGVNYDLLKDAYLMEAKVAALQKHLYGEKGSKLGYTVKDEYLEENYVHFRQVFLASYHYVYETDENGDVIYYYAEGEQKDRVYYDVYNGVVGYDKDGKELKDENGDVIYFVKDSDQKKIAYDTTHGMPAYQLNKDGSDYETKEMTVEELEELAKKADGLYNDLKDSTDAEFESVIKTESDDFGDSTDYNDGYYLQKGVDFTASGSNYGYLEQIVTALDDMEVGEVTMIKSSFGYHIVKKYSHSEKAYEKEENEVWFENFSDSLIEKLFLEECQKHFTDIKVADKVLTTAPTMKEVGINYYY